MQEGGFEKDGSHQVNEASSVGIQDSPSGHPRDHWKEGRSKKEKRDGEKEQEKQEAGREKERERERERDLAFQASPRLGVHT